MLKQEYIDWFRPTYMMLGGIFVLYHKTMQTLWYDSLYAQYFASRDNIFKNQKLNISLILLNFNNCMEFTDFLIH